MVLPWCYSDVTVDNLSIVPVMSRLPPVCVSMCSVTCVTVVRQWCGSGVIVVLQWCDIGVTVDYNDVTVDKFSIVPVTSRLPPV
jgi:hypothetical protein